MSVGFEWSKFILTLWEFYKVEIVSNNNILYWIKMILYFGKICKFYSKFKGEFFRFIRIIVLNIDFKCKLN